jgi:hypothetical protein
LVIRECRTLVKIGGYALLGWGLCFLMARTISQSAVSHARRIASDVLAGKKMYLVCYVASWILVSVGVAFRPVNAANNAANPSGGAVLKTTVATLSQEKKRMVWASI